MAEYKTYERQVQSEGSPQADYLTPAQSLINTLNEFSSNRMKQAQGISNYQAAKAGKEAGNTLSYQEKTPITEADRAFVAAAQQANQALIHTEIQTQTMKFREDALNNLNPNSAFEFNAKFDGFSKGLMEQVSPDNQTYAKNLLDYYGTTNQLHVTGAVRGLNKQIVLANTLDFVNKVSGQATNAAFDGDIISAAALFNDMDRKLQSALATGMISGAQYESQKQAARSDINVSNYLGQFQRHLNAGQGAEAYHKFINETHADITSKGDNLSYLEADTIRSKMHAMLQAWKQEQALKYGSLANQVKDFDTAASQPGINENDLKAKGANLVSQILAVHPDDSYERRQLLGQVEFSFTKQNVLNEARWMSPAEREAIANQLQAEEQKRGVNLTAQEASNYSALINSVRAMDKQAKEDPAAYSFQHPAVQEALKTRQLMIDGQQSLTGDNLQTGGLPQQNAQNADPYYSAIQVQKRLGIPDKNISLLTKVEAADFANSISDLGAEDALKAVQQKLAQYSVYQTKADQQKLAQYSVYQTIVAKDLSKVVKFPVMALNTAFENPSTRGRMALLYQAANNSDETLSKLLTKDQSKGLNDAVREAIQANYGEAVLNMPGDPTKNIDAYIDIAARAAKVYALNGISAPAEQAVNDLVNGHINTFRVNGHLVMAPKDVDAGSAQKGILSLLKSIKSDNITVPGYLYQGLQEDRRKELYLNDLVINGMAAMSENQDGMYLVDQNKVPVLDAKGNNIGFNFNDLTDPTKVDLHKDLTVLDKALAQQDIIRKGKPLPPEVNYILAR
jgi:hypothetical protein